MPGDGIGIKSCIEALAVELLPGPYTVAEFDEFSTVVGPVLSLLLERQQQYSIALQRAIEYKCRDKMVPDDIAVLCPHHAKMLNTHTQDLRDE